MDRPSSSQGNPGRSWDLATPVQAASDRAEPGLTRFQGLVIPALLRPHLAGPSLCLMTHLGVVLPTQPIWEGVFSDPDWISLGVVTAIVGAFLIANATLFEHPRRLVARYFGAGSGRLQSVREYVYNRVQTTLGFAFLLAGFGMQLFGHLAAKAPGETPLNMAWVGLIVVAAVVLLFSAWWWSLWAFRRYVREYFLQHPIELEQHGNVAREIGELFGVESREDDTVQTYAQRTRSKAGLPPAKARTLGYPGFDEAEFETEETI